MSRELTRKEKTAIRSLVVTWCANYDREYGCLPLDSDCYMLGKCWTGSYCRYFRESVLPLDPALEVALISEGPRPDFKIPGMRRACYPGQAAGVLFGGLCKEKPTAASNGNICGKSGGHPLTIRACKTRLYQGFPGPFRWPAVSFYGLAPFAPMLSTSIQRDFGTISPEVPAF